MLKCEDGVPATAKVLRCTLVGCVLGTVRTHELEPRKRGTAGENKIGFVPRGSGASTRSQRT